MPKSEFSMKSAGIAALASLSSALSPGSAWATNGFDEGVRDLLRADSSQWRSRAGTTSDILVTSMVVAPYLNEGLRIRNSTLPAPGYNGLWVNTGAFAITGVLTMGVKHVVGRERPYVRNCASNATYDFGCGTADEDQSFFSGHTSWSFTGAGLICSNRETSSTLCYSAVGVAATTGVLRIVADKHYATDVLVGALVGASVGYFFPLWMESLQDRTGSDSQVRIGVTPFVDARHQLGVVTQIRF